VITGADIYKPDSVSVTHIQHCQNLEHSKQLLHFYREDFIPGKMTNYFDSCSPSYAGLVSMTWLVLQIYEGRSINNLQNGVILLNFKM